MIDEPGPMFLDSPVMSFLMNTFKGVSSTFWIFSEISFWASVCLASLTPLVLALVAGLAAGFVVLTGEGLALAGAVLGDLVVVVPAFGRNRPVFGSLCAIVCFWFLIYSTKIRWGGGIKKMELDYFLNFFAARSVAASDAAGGNAVNILPIEHQIHSSYLLMLFLMLAFGNAVDFFVYPDLIINPQKKGPEGPLM
jgi:hypothetical protein